MDLNHVSLMLDVTTQPQRHNDCPQMKLIIVKR